MFTNTDTDDQQLTARDEEILSQLEGDESSTYLSVKDYCESLGSYTPIKPSQVYDELCSIAQKGLMRKEGNTFFLID